MSTAAGKKIAIVTGSALGLGYELARQLIGKGWFVAGIDFNTAVRRNCPARSARTNTAPSSATSATRRS